MSTTLFTAFGVLAPLHGFLRRFAIAKIVPAVRPVSPSVNAPALNRSGESSSKPMAEPAYYTRPRIPARSGSNAIKSFVGQSKERLHPLRGPREIRAGGAKPLRVIRVMESGQSLAHGGRMMISGRMADVCAELDRMAEREAALQVSV